jgi:hypothetical protein
LTLCVLAAPSSIAQNSPPANAPAPAAGPTAVFLSIISSGNGSDDFGAAYEGPVTKAEIQQDFAALQRALGQPEKPPEISSEGGVGGGKAKLVGLTNWQTGEVNLAAIATAFRRFGTIRVLGLFSGNFPAKQITEIRSPKARVSTQVGGYAVSYEIVVEDPTGKSDGPALFGFTQGRGGGGWVLPVLLVLMAGLIAGLAVYLVLSRRRPERAPQGNVDASS